MYQDLAALLSTADDPSVDPLLDAALEQFQTFGLRRSTMEDVARRAGVGRMTLYRRFPKKDQLVQAVMMREARRLVAYVDARIDAIADPTERAVEAFLLFVRSARSNELLIKLIDLERDGLLGKLTLEAGPLLAIGRGYIARFLRRAQRELGVTSVDTEQVAEMFARLALSLVLTRDTCLPLDDEKKLRAFALRTIVPMILPRPKR